MPPHIITLLQTKLRRPPLVAGLLPRPHLWERLNQAATCTLTLVTAPAGSGKTSLVDQWLEQCSLPAAWLQLDAGDSDPSLFFAYIVHALRQIAPAFASETEILHGTKLAPPAVLASALSNELDQLRLSTPCLLVLDDYHLVQNPEIDRALADLLLRPPHNFHLLVLSRQPPAWPLGKLRLQQRLLEIGVDDLRFTREETAAYLNLSATIPLPDDMLARLQKQTEGWAAGLQLAALALRQTQDAQALLGEDGGLIGFVGSNNRYLLEYMVDEVLAHLPAGLLDFMYATAICSRFTVPLCQALTGEERGTVKSYLRTLRETNLFLVPLDAGVEGSAGIAPGEGYAWYRYHHLMQQTLEDRLLDMATPAAVVELHRRAAVWLGEGGYVDEALDHLTLIADWDAAARLLASQLDPLLNREDRRTIERWLDRIPAAEIASRPSLLLIEAWIGFFNLDIPGLAQKLEQAGEADTRPHPARDAAGWQPPFDSHFVLLRGVVDYFMGRQEATIAATQQALALAPRTSTFVYSSAYFYLATAMQQAGQSVEAEELVAEAYRREQPKPSPGSARLLFALVSVHFFSGKLSAAYEAGEMLLHEARAVGLALLEGWAHDVLGRIDYERNRLEAAASHFAPLRERRYSVHRGCAYDGFTGAMLVAAVRGQTGVVAQISGEWRSFEQSLWGLPGPLYYSAQARAALLTGDTPAALHWAGGFTAPLLPAPMFWLEASHATKICCLLAGGAAQDLAAANVLAEECLTVATRSHNRPMTIRLVALRSLLLDAAGRRPAALDLLSDCLRLAVDEGYVRSFVDLGKEMESLLKAIPDAQLRPYLTMLRAAFFGPQTGGGEPARQSAPHIRDAHPAAALTQRELEILALLSTSMTLQEIGEKLFISPSTVRQHAAHIYEKLGVNKRRHAVLMAAELHLFTSSNGRGNHA